MNSKPGAGVQMIRVRDAEAVGRQAADLVASQLVWQPKSTMVFPTGNTPLPMYAALRHMPRLSWQSARLFHLDEYVPPPGYHGTVRYETYEEYMRRELWDVVLGHPEFFGHYTADPQAYERRINAEGGPDMVVLGIGANGHIAFNEPGSSPNSPARRIEMADLTIRRNFKLSERDFPPGQPLDREKLHRMGYPTEAVTLGLDTILKAKKIVLLATGADKQAIVKRAFDPNTPPSPDIPASWLKNHPNVTVITDFDV